MRFTLICFWIAGWFFVWSHFVLLWSVWFVQLRLAWIDWFDHFNMNRLKCSTSNRTTRSFNTNLHDHYNSIHKQVRFQFQFQIVYRFWSTTSTWGANSDVWGIFTYCGNRLIGWHTRILVPGGASYFHHMNWKRLPKLKT